MYYLCCVVFILSYYFSYAFAYLRIHHTQRTQVIADDQDDDRGNPLILTPYLQQGRIKEAKMLSRVNFAEFGETESYSGYFTVDELYNSNLFFWFFPSRNDYENAPVVLWLQGGPGGSSLYGLFVENGPLGIDENENVILKNNSWVENHSVIYIDNPVGTGFSFTDSGYAQNQTIVGELLYDALMQFFQLFPELKNNDFFVTGESYAGKYVPAVSYMIHTKNRGAEQKINLQGIAIGDGLIDPYHQTRGYVDFLYQIGLIDFAGKLIMQKYENETVANVENERWLEAQAGFNTIAHYFQNTSGFNNIYNFLISDDILDDTNARLEKFLRRSDVMKAIHAANITFYAEKYNVYNYLKEDFMQSVAHWLSELLNHYRVLIYNGQLDIIVAYPLTLNFLNNLHFDSEKEYKIAERFQWYVNFEIAGYVKTAGNLTEVLVRNAGHMVSSDQPAWALDLITKFTRNVSLY